MKKIIKNFLNITGYTLIIRKKYSGNSSDDYLRLKENYSRYNPLKLHFGCGPRVMKDWINIDLFYIPYEKYLNNLTEDIFPKEVRGTREDFYRIDVTSTQLPIPDNSVDLIFHEDFLEHLSQRDQIIFLSESYRILKKGGVHRVNTPDLVSSIVNHSHFSLGGVGVYTEEWDRSDHQLVLTKNYLKEIALTIGYENIFFNQRDKSISKDVPKEFRPSKDKDTSFKNIFADLVK